MTCSLVRQVPRRPRLEGSDLLKSSGSSAFKCAVWLNSFLQRRGLQTADGRGLYEYHCSYAEYLDLKQVLKAAAGSNGSVRDLAACACLVLFGSEWYRREYQSSCGWSWEPIWTALEFRLSAAELSTAIPKGLEGYWKRPIHSFIESERRDFLGSLFSEGGLPFQVLREEGSRFQVLFDRILKHYDQCHLMGFTTLQQARQHLEKTTLPQAFSSPTSVELIAHMTDQLVALVRDYTLIQTSEPVARLDAMNPKWRELFPLPLDNQTGNELLNGLLKTATEEGKKQRKPANGWACRHFWDEGLPDVLKVQLSMPAEVAFRLEVPASTTRFELEIFEGEKAIASIGPGYATVDNGLARIRLRQREVIARRQDCTAQLHLVALAGGLVMASLPIEASSVALGDAPLGFEQGDGRWQLCGQASFTTAKADLMLVMPLGASISVAEGTGEAIIAEASAICGLPSVRAQGRGQLQVQCEDSYRIRLGHTAGSGLDLELTGSLLYWPTRPALSFIGLPRVRWPAGSGEQQQQGSELYIAGKKPGSGILQDMLGAHYVSVRNHAGDTLLRRKAGILPADFRLELRSGEAPGQGSVLIYTQQNCLFQIDDASVQVKKLKHSDHTELKLSAGAFPPVKVRLLVTPSLLADPVEIELPFPNAGFLAIGASGKPLKRNFCIEELLGARLYLFGRGGVPTRYGLELALKGNTARNARYTWSYTASDKPLEISLFNLKEQIIDLLSLHSGIDQAVELRIFGSGYDECFRIRNYSTDMRLDRERQVVYSSTLNDSGAALPEPELMLLHDPFRSSVSLRSRTSEGVSTGEFELPALIERDGPWLMVPKAGSSVAFRPLFIAGGWEPVSAFDDVQSLQKAVLTFDHTAVVSSFTPVLNAMAINPMHSGWQFLRALYEGYGYLPLATFEVWKALVSNTRALAMALFKFEMNTVFLGRLEAEFPLLWECLPVKDIKQAASRFADVLAERGVDPNAVNNLMDNLLSRLEQIYPTYGKNVQGYLLNRPVGQDIQIPPALFRNIVVGWYQELIRERSEAEWPSFGGQPLERWHNTQADSVLAFTPEMDFRKAVVYLPIFAAAVASGRARFDEVFADHAEAIFFLRQIRDFDSNWFNSLYQYCLLNNVMNPDKAVLVNE